MYVKVSFNIVGKHIYHGNFIFPGWCLFMFREVLILCDIYVYSVWFIYLRKFIIIILRFVDAIRGYYVRILMEEAINKESVLEKHMFLDCRKQNAIN